MKRSNRLVILVGVLLAVLAFVAIIIVLNNNTTTQPTLTTVPVLVAKSDIAIGDAVKPDLVEVKQVAPDAVVPTRIGDPSQLTGA
ncbi:MAG TPA: SAF domain-containing protein, partial [Candidatus Saccharimonadales bacterium]|nr:SAF domain-containing protein [Candidatus Saccharimonadales bacterium]